VYFSDQEKEPHVINDQLYEAIKKQLKKAKEPVTCNDIFDAIDVRQLDNVTNFDVSNALAALWRRGVLERFSIKQAHGRGPRYSYSIRRDASLDAKHVPAAKAVNVDALNIQHNEDGGVTITTDRLQITVKPFAK
jgi:hypothetical protein